MIIWLASYPKSGNTWLRFFIISLLMGDKTNLNLNHLNFTGVFNLSYHGQLGLQMIDCVYQLN